MQFLTGKSNDRANQSSSGFRSPIANLFKSKKQDEAESELPEMDVTGALNRILNNQKPVKKSPSTTRVQDPIREALAAIESSLFSIDRIREVIEQGFEIVLSANDVEDAGGRALLAESYDELRMSIDNVVETADERAVILIGHNAHQVDVGLGGKAYYTLTPMCMDTSDKGLNLTPPRGAFAKFEEITDILEQLDSGLKKADRAAASYCKDAQYLIGRLRD